MKSKLVLRLFGFFLLIIGLWVYWRGGIPIPLEYKDFSVLLPLHYLSIFLGLLIFIEPVLVLYFATIFLRGGARDNFVEYIKRLEDPEIEQENVSPESLAKKMRLFVQKSNKRYYMTLFGFLLFLIVVLPMLVSEVIARSNFRKNSNKIISMTQEIRVDFVNADRFMQQIRSAEPSLIAYPSNHTATQKLYDILSSLYRPQPENIEEFENRMSNIYDAEIRAYLDPASGMVEMEKIQIPYQSSLESINAPVTLLTLLAIVAHNQNNQGKFLDPVIQSMQLINLANNYDSSHLNLPATSNMLGLCYSGLIGSYKDYQSKFNSESIAKSMEENLGHSGPLKVLALARLADQKFLDAKMASSRHYTRVRFINNNVDLKIKLIRAYHINNEPMDASADSDHKFLDKVVVVDKASKDFKYNLIEVLESLREKLDEATKPPCPPPIFFTRAQLYCLIGELNKIYKFNHHTFGNSDLLKKCARADIETAKSQGVSAKYFHPSDSEVLGIAWAFKEDGDSENVR